MIPAPPSTPPVAEYAGGVQLPLKNRGRSLYEKAFLIVFLPAVVGFYLIYKYPHWLTADPGRLHLLGKAPGFWYMLIYTSVVCGIAAWVLGRDRNLYRTSHSKGALSAYQRNKFRTIFLVQLVAFFLVPFVIAPLAAGRPLWPDPVTAPAKNAHVYVSPAFRSLPLALYVFGVIPLSVWFFGKRYCTWFCACGNLAETVGITPWGAGWVRHGTPRGPVARRLEVLATIGLGFAMVFGLFIVLDGARIVTAPDLMAGLQATQDLLIDFVFGSVIGVGAYPFLGTRIWCRFGCPLAKGMQLLGHLFESRFRVVPNEACKGLGLCTQACPMGIDVAAYAHKDRQPIQVPFGLPETPCIGCGGCIEACPVGALSFADLSGESRGSGEDPSA